MSSDSACFDRYQCDFEGFTCKSNVTECVEAHDNLVNDYNRLLADHKELADLARQKEERLQSLQFCIEYAGTLDEAQRCNF